MEFSRMNIINACINTYGYKHFLEIGLDEGLCRDGVFIDNKTSVDPSPYSDNPTHFMTSDDFFKQNKEKFDIVFVDGLHEANQVYRDIINSLDFLLDGGTILCHDMMPMSKNQQTKERNTLLWLGDCWKAYAKLKGTRSDLEMFIVDQDYGVGVIRRGSQEISKELDIDISEMDWDFYVKHKDFLNYVSWNEFGQKLKYK